MRYWWVNQNETYKHEVPGGYLWSPKLKANGHRNPFYEFMREVSPGDLIFSFSDTYIRAIGVALSNAQEAPKPMEFGKAGAYWDQIGWRVEMRFTELHHLIRPMENMDRLRPYLPSRYSPLRPNGHGQQSIYLAEIDEKFAFQLVDLIGTEARAILQTWTASTSLQEIVLNGHVVWEEHLLQVLKDDRRIADTEKEAIVLARRGQGLFKARVARIERRCRVTGATNAEYLRASHTKPWRDASNEERLDGENGFLLTPDVDLLFDRGFISFEDGGDVLVSPVADMSTFERMGISAEMLRNVGSFSEGQRRYLEFHRESVFLKARLQEKQARRAQKQVL
jgi:putative restriction endonuclease